jgi:hypothetical protein
MNDEENCKKLKFSRDEKSKLENSANADDKLKLRFYLQPHNLKLK